MTSTDESSDREVPGLLEVLVRVPDPRALRGRRYLLTFVLAPAVACALAGARNFREAGDHAAGLPQNVLARLGGRPHPLLQRITCLSGKHGAAHFSFTGLFIGAPDLSERSGEILREEFAKRADADR